MLASNKKKERSAQGLCCWYEADGRPQGNDRYVRTAPSNPKLTRWAYDDDVSYGLCYCFSWLTEDCLIMYADCARVEIKL